MAPVASATLGNVREELLELIRGCCRDDAAAWESFLPIFEAIGTKALRAFRFSADKQLDIRRDVLVRLYAGGLRQFRGTSPGQAVNFIKEIVRNRALDVLVDERRTAPIPEGYQAEERDPAGAGADDVGKKVADEECKEFLRRELERLPREEKELFLMRARGMKEREIAEQTGRPLGTIGARVARLVEKLRARLKELGC